MHTLYYVPGACSLCPHIILHEAGLAFKLDKVDPKTKQTESGKDYNAINPKGYVPALTIEHGDLLTEVAVIAQYLADKVPVKALAPPAITSERYHLQEWLNFISSEIHKGFGPMFNPKMPEEAKALGKERLALRLGHPAKKLAESDYLMGKSFSVADTYLYTVLRWAPHLGFDLSPWPSLQAFMQRIGARPAVKKALAEEGLE